MENSGRSKLFAQKCMEACDYLKLILHSQSCSGGCSQKGCRKVIGLLMHIEDCEGCCTPGCLQTKKILKHYKDCRLSRQQAILTGSPKKYCPLCSSAQSDENVIDSLVNPKRKVPLTLSRFL